MIVSCWGTSLAPVVRTGFLEEVGLKIGWVLMLREQEASGRTPSLLGRPPQPGSYCPHCLGCTGTGRKNTSPAAGAVKDEGRMRGSPQDS